MIDVEPRKQEQPGHPEDDEGHVGGLDPWVSQAKEAGPVAHFSPFTMLSSCSTCAIGVSGMMPCPRLKMCGRSANASRIRLTALVIALPPAIKASGSRLPCTGRSSGSSLAAHKGST